MTPRDMNTYERVTFKSEGMARAQSVILQITADTDTFLVGIEVDVEQMPVSGKGFDERKRMIDKGAIVRRTPLQMNLTYGVLEATR